MTHFMRMWEHVWSLNGRWCHPDVSHPNLVMTHCRVVFRSADACADVIMTHLTLTSHTGT